MTSSKKEGFIVENSMQKRYGLFTAISMVVGIVIGSGIFFKAIDGLPKNVIITPGEVRDALADTVSNILDAVRTTLEKTPPELAGDVVNRGIVLTGGGALLRGLDRVISDVTGISVEIAENPLDCVVEGTLKRIEMGIDESFFDRRRKYN